VAAAIVNPVVNRSVPMAVVATAYRSGSKRADVVIAAELGVTHLYLEQRETAAQGEAEVAAVAISAEGRVSGSQRERFMLRLTPDQWVKAKAQGVRVVTGMALPPGRYQLRVAGGGVNAAQAGHVLYDLAVPDFSKAPLAMSGLAVTSRRAENTVVVPSTTAHVLVPAPASATRTFAAGDVLSVYVEIYDNRAKTPHRLALVARLQDVDGHTVGREVGDARQDGQPTQKFAATLPLDVPVGDYVLHVEARSTLANQPPVSRDIPLRVQ
jgi:hypothetical protein